jgi:hypothetical protein
MLHITLLIAIRSVQLWFGGFLDDLCLWLFSNTLVTDIIIFLHVLRQLERQIFLDKFVQVTNELFQLEGIPLLMNVRMDSQRCLEFLDLLEGRAGKTSQCRGARSRGS